MKFKFWGFAIPAVSVLWCTKLSFFSKLYQAYSANTVCVDVQFKDFKVGDMYLNRFPVST
jgi:hypothetical protein